MYKGRNELEFQAKTKNKILFKGILHEGGENGKISKIQDSLSSSNEILSALQRISLLPNLRPFFID